LSISRAWASWADRCLGCSNSTNATTSGR